MNDQTPPTMQTATQPTTLPVLLAALTALGTCTTRQLKPAQRQRAAHDLQRMATAAGRTGNTALQRNLHSMATTLRQGAAGRAL